jgi:uncharacterized protein (TIGR02453 family)
MSSFKGFSSEAIEFLVENRKRNDKDWFKEHRSIYESEVLEPLKALVTGLRESILEIDPELDVRPAVGKTISRINNDIRFSKDKVLYRDHMWIAFRRPIKDKTNLPGFYFGFDKDGYGTGMGVYGLTTDYRYSLRDLLKKRAGDFSDALSRALSEPTPFTLLGENYKRTQDPDVPEELQIISQKKELSLRSSHDSDETFRSPHLIDLIRDEFGRLAPLYHLLVLARG